MVIITIPVQQVIDPSQEKPPNAAAAAAAATVAGGGDGVGGDGVGGGAIPLEVQLTDIQRKFRQERRRIAQYLEGWSLGGRCGAPGSTCQCCNEVVCAPEVSPCCDQCQVSFSELRVGTQARNCGGGAGWRLVEQSPGRQNSAREAAGSRRVGGCGAGKDGAHFGAEGRRGLVFGLTASEVIAAWDDAPRRNVQGSVLPLLLPYTDA